MTILLTILIILLIAAQLWLLADIKYNSGFEAGFKSGTDSMLKACQGTHIDMLVKISAAIYKDKYPNDETVNAKKLNKIWLMFADATKSETLGPADSANTPHK